MKVVYGMRLVTASIGQSSTIENKLLTISVEGVSAIIPSRTLVLDVTVRDKVLVKNLTLYDVQTFFSNGHVAGHQLEISSNVTDEELIMKVSPIPEYLIYDGF